MDDSYTAVVALNEDELRIIALGLRALKQLNGRNPRAAEYVENITKLESTIEREINAISK